MIKRLFFVVCLYCASHCSAYSQSLPPQTCGVVYTYDAAGNRVQRSYLCNNSPGRIAKDEYAKQAAGSFKSTADSLANNASQAAVQIYPNPTSGPVKVDFSRPLKNARVTLLDFKGQVLLQTTRSGKLLLLDLSAYPAAVYILQVIDGSGAFSFRVTRQ